MSEQDYVDTIDNNDNNSNDNHNDDEYEKSALSATDQRVWLER